MSGHCRLACKLKDRRGQAVGDYLLITAAIAGIALPIAWKYLAAPLNDSLLSQRQSLVTFLAQDRKQTVPSVWFSQEDQGETGGDKPVSDVKQFEDPDVKEPGNLKNVGRLNASNPKQPGQLKVGNLNQPGQVSVGGGGGGGGAGAGAGGGGGGGDSGMSGDFFGGGDNKKNLGGAGETGGGEGEGTYGKGGGRFSSGDGGGEESVEDGGGRKGSKNEQTNGEKASTGDTSHKSTLEGMRKVEEEQARKAKAFDWWMLIKILIVALIFFLILLIVLSNLKRA